MARYGTAAHLDMEWVEDWARKVNEDRVLRVIGRFFTANFVLGIEDKDYLMGWQFALRAPVGSWAKFVQPVPPPMYNDIWAMAHPIHGKLKIEGDTKPFWQNLRALSWMLAIMRQV